MSSHQKKLRKQLEQILSAELATAANLSDMHKRMALTTLYHKSGMDAAFQAELNRLKQQFPDHPSVLTNVIKMLIEQRALRQLHIITEGATKIVRLSQECPLELRLAVAKAYIALNRPDAASFLYAEMLAHNELTDDVIRQLAEFMCANLPEFKLVRTLQNIADNSSYTSTHPLFLYAMSKAYLYTGDCIKADRYLSSIQAGNIDQSEIAFDLSVIAFRLADLKKAKEMAQQALKISPEHLSAAGFLVSVHSFAADMEAASKQFEELKRLYSPLSLSCQQAKAILKFASEQTEPEPASGVISHSYWSKNKSAINFGSPGNTPLITKDQADVVTTSVFGPKTVDVRPWDILINIDRRLPHVMVQQLNNFQIIHAFIATNDVESWPWQEVPVIVRSNECILDKNILRWVPSKNTFPSNSGTTLTNSLFEQVEREIKSANFLEEL